MGLGDHVSETDHMTATTTDLVDGTGKKFADVRAIVGPRADWPPLPEEWKFHGKTILREFAAEFDFCFLCGVKGDWRGLQTHHIIGGARRIDARWNFCRVCATCHGEVAGRLANVLFAKWSCDLKGTNWCKLTVARGSWLPDPVFASEPKARRRA